MSVASVWRTNRSSITTKNGDMVGFKIRSFLRKQGDASTPFEAPPGVSRTNPDWWSGGLDSEERDLEFHATKRSPSGWGDGYQGLTPAGLREFLRLNAKNNWPSSYEGLVEAGLGHKVAEWLEFVVGYELNESLVISTFLDMVCELTFSEVQDSSADGGQTRFDSTMQEAVSARSTLAQALAQALVGTQPRMWPEKVVHFAEWHVVV